MFEKLIEIISEYTEVEKSRITPDVSIRELGLNSYDFMNVVAACEEKFSLVIPERDIHQLETIGDIVRYIEKATAA